MKANREKEAKLSHARLVEVLRYDAEIGRFRWNVHKRSAPEGMVAGACNGKHKYRVIRIDYVKYSEHRLVWFFHNGEWPKDQIDHVNGVRDDNRIENLREATYAQNLQNTRAPQKNGRSGYLGVSWRGAVGKWRALIQVNGKRKELGIFDDPKEAHAVYIKAKRELHPYGTL